MAQEPTFPTEAQVGAGAGGGGGGGGETLDVAKSAKAAEQRLAENDDAPEARSNRTRNYAIGAAVGVGSAALMAALLYARSRRSSDKGDKKS